MPYRVEFTSAAKRDFANLLTVVQRRLLHPILSLAETPRPPEARKLQGESTAWRIRLGQFRVVYDVSDHQQLVVILKVARRNEATYRR